MEETTVWGRKSELPIPERVQEDTCDQVFKKRTHLDSLVGDLRAFCVKSDTVII